MTENAVEGLLDAFPVVVTLPVQWGEMDYFRHVNNTVFFRYFESARIAYLERIGFREEGAAEGRGPILASTHARFRRPLTYPDTVRVGARTTELGDDRFTMEYRLVSEAQGAVAAEGGGVLVSFDYAAGRKAPLPAGVRGAIQRLEGGRAAGAADRAR
ncbi:MAG TPA: thioesterase family protein [Longimicrobiaceae bacterium]|nr:thioesterase family protein [Longimicrobiaceae bacterium]